VYVLSAVRGFVSGKSCVRVGQKHSYIRGLSLLISFNSICLASPDILQYICNTQRWETHGKTMILRCACFFCFFAGAGKVGWGSDGWDVCVAVLQVNLAGIAAKANGDGGKKKWDDEEEDAGPEVAKKAAPTPEQVNFWFTEGKRAL
jgi:hypothetical protein